MQLEIHRRKGQPIPEGWALNEEGAMETDPEIAFGAKRLLPVGGDEGTGGYKGYGLAMMVEVLAGILSGNINILLVILNNRNSFRIKLRAECTALERRNKRSSELGTRVYSYRSFSIRCWIRRATKRFHKLFTTNGMCKFESKFLS